MRPPRRAHPVNPFERDRSTRRLTDSNRRIPRRSARPNGPSASRIARAGFPPACGRARASPPAARDRRSRPASRCRRRRGACSPSRASCTTSLAMSSTVRLRNGVASAVLGTASRSACRSSAVQVCDQLLGARRARSGRRGGPTQSAGSAQSRRHGPAVGAAHLQIGLEPHLGKERREMVLPVAHGRPRVGQVVRRHALHELAEGEVRHVVVAAVAHDEIHRHVERPVDVGLEAEAVEEGEGQHAGAVADRCRARSRRGRRRKPFGLFSVKGELAKSAVAIGCSARPTRILSRMSASPEKSRFTCTVQVRNIMSRPCPPTFGM